MRTVRVTQGDLRRELRLNGTVAAQEYAMIVAPRLRGRGGPGGGDFQMILMKLAKPGGLIQKGEVVAEFDRQWQLQRVDDQQAEVVQAEAAIAKRQAELDVLMQTERQNLQVARADHEKAKLDLKTTEIRSAIDAEKLKLAVEEAAARAKQLEQEVRLTEVSQRAEIRALEIKRDRAKIERQRAENNADKMIIRAPISGIVVMQSTFRGGQFGQVQEGDQVYPGTSFMQIVNPASMVLNAAVNQTESQEFRLGQNAEIRLDAYPDQVWRGRLISMGAMAGNSLFGFRGGSRSLYVKQIPVRFSIEARDPRIIPDLSSSASVVLREEKNVAIAPLEAVEKENGSCWALVKTEGGFERRRVELGLANETQVAVRSGLQAGEEVALERSVALAAR
ncbi:MAG: HlyD family efflux transporter periplasmic adaptor subunit [Acidobacteria bacterium]|nr:HlyD family efflux transporter periplasmic adaptor subunit [Acidobacteriota bacterium]